ncbi:MAG: CDP-alcohol phosphatidyltransferase family protein [Coriobacteriia bacterium]|nr:CDP-alcohol phosphatidyltransferase family protein [Coriobacteriia bacterium]MBN2839755.1 CDP-alcohol phosphatidyltransferase family protein [Coriobacteriia bacterium]
MVDEHETPVHEQVVHHTVYSVANLITILRLILVPFFFTALVDAQNERGRLVAFIIYAVAASTDWIDGQIARRTNTVTQFGKIVDPLVDRLLLASGVVGLYLIDVLPLWIPTVLLARDLYLLYGAYLLEHHGVLLPVTRAGKWTTAVLLAGFSSLIAGWPKVSGLGVIDTGWLPGFGSSSAAAGIYFVYVGIILSLSAAAQYTVRAVRARREALESLRGGTA